MVLFLQSMTVSFGMFGFFIDSVKIPMLFLSLGCLLLSEFLRRVKKAKAKRAQVKPIELDWGRY